MTPEMESCARHCQVAEKGCLLTITFCLERGGKYARVDAIRALLDCAEMCQTTANALERDSEIADRECGVCAEACERAAALLEKIGDDSQIAACVRACRRAADSCRRIAAPSINIV